MVALLFKTFRRIIPDIGIFYEGYNFADSELKFLYMKKVECTERI